MNLKDIQDEVVIKYKVDLCDGTKCKSDRSRTHAHIKEKRVCKWKQANSIKSTFTLFHEIGHIMTKKSTMRRCESEYYATVWAINEMQQYGLETTEKIISDYQKYIYRELERGVRRGGLYYPTEEEMLLRKEERE